MVGPAALANRVIVAAAGHPSCERGRREGMVDPKATAGAGAPRMAEPGVLPRVAVLAAPEIDQADRGELAEGPARLEAIALRVHEREARVIVAEHEKGPRDATRQP